MIEARKPDNERNEPAQARTPDRQCPESGSSAGAPGAPQQASGPEQQARSASAEASGPPGQGAAGAEAPQPPETEDLARQVEQLRSELEQMQDRALRAQAELENYRKRVARQREEERRYAELLLIRDLLPVFDDVHRAIAAAENSDNTEGLLQGFRMVAEKLELILRRHHCTPIEAAGKPFDPNIHEAIAQVPTSECPPNTVVEVTQVGFRLHDRVVRPSQVVVSSAAIVAEKPGNTDQQPQEPDTPREEHPPPA